MDHTESLDHTIQKKTEKLAKYLDGRTHVKWSCSVTNGKHYAEVNISGPHFDYHASGNSDSLYKTIDKVIGKIEKQLVKKKEKMKERRSKKAPHLVILEPQDAWLDYDSSTDYDDVKKAA
jgi:putative sigma-54 modulation protein